MRLTQYAIKTPLPVIPVVDAVIPSELHGLEKLQPSIDLSDPQYRKIFVGGLPHNLALCDFRDYFSQFGMLEDCVILKDKRTQKPRGFGFVTYCTIHSVSSVMQMKQKHIIQGKWVDCKSAIPVNEMKLIELKGREELKELGLTDHSSPQQTMFPNNNHRNSPSYVNSPEKPMTD